MVPSISRSKTAPVQHRDRIEGDEDDTPVSRGKLLRRSQTTSISREDAENRDDSIISKAVAMLATPPPLSTLFGENNIREQPPRDKFKADLHSLTYTDLDLISIINEDEAFRTLQTSLRQRGCTTNAYLQQTFHFFVAHVKHVRANRKDAASSRKQRSSRRQRMRRQTTLSAAA